MANVLELLEKADWDTLIPNLLYYAESRVRSYGWSTAQGLPKGKTPSDFVFDAIAKTYEAANDLAGKKGKKGQRSWNPETVPDLSFFLKEVIKSDIGHLAQSLEHKNTNYNDNVTTDQVEGNIEQQIHSCRESDKFGNPETAVIENEFEAQLLDKFATCWDLLESALEKDSVALDVLTVYQVLIEDGHYPVKHPQIAEELDIKIEDVRNAMKRISRKAKTVIKGVEDGQKEN